MKKTPLNLLATIALSISSIPALAAVTPVNIVLHDANLSYPVPRGKVLIIEHFIWALEISHTSQSVAITPPNDPSSVGSFQWSFDSDKPTSWTPPRPIRLVGGDGASVFIIGNGSQAADWRDVMVVGLLVDPEDLYAAKIPTDLTNPRIEGGRLIADATFASPRPRVTKVSSTEKLDGLTEDPTGQVRETVSPASAIVSAKADAPKKFIAVKTIARSE